MSEFICDNLLKKYGKYFDNATKRYLNNHYNEYWLDKKDVYELTNYVYSHQVYCKDIVPFTKLTANIAVLESIPSVISEYSFGGYGCLTNIKTLITKSSKKVREEARELTCLLDIHEYLTYSTDTYYCEVLADVILSGLYAKDINYLTTLWMAYKMARYNKSKG